MKIFIFSIMSLVLFVSIEAYGIISGDVGLMIELVSTTASQLNELEKLVSNGEKYTQKMQQYNELSQDKIFQSERVLSLANELAAKQEMQNLGDLNTAIKNLKLSINDLKGQLKDYVKVEKEHDILKAEIKQQENFVKAREARAEVQVDHSIKAKTQARANQLTAQNTALILENQTKMQKTQLELLKQVALTNKLLSSEFKGKRIKEIKKLQSYGIQGKEKQHGHK